MARDVWTAAELEQMTPAEHDAAFEASIVTDLREVPPVFLKRVRARVEQRIADAEATDQR
jgi:hypothetical protein